MMTWEKVLLGTVLPLFVVSTVATTSVPAHAEDRRERAERSDGDQRSDRRRDRRRGGTSTGEAIAIGIGGLILGAILSDGDILDNDRRYYSDHDYYRERDYYRYRDRYNHYDRGYSRRCIDEQIVWFDRRGRQRIDYRLRCPGR